MSVHEAKSLMYQRGEFLATTGMVNYTDVNDQLLNTLESQYIPQIDADVYENYQRTVLGRSQPEQVTTDQAATSLYLVMTHLRNLIPVGDEDFRSQHGFSAQDENEALKHGIFGYGFENMDFPWHFSAGLANAIADAFIDGAVLTAQQKEYFTLHDWAHIVGSEWFGKLANSLAFTGRHAYRLFGYDLKDYQRDSLREHLSPVLSVGEEALFDLEWASDSGDTYPIAKLSKLATYKLRDQMKRSEQINGEPSTGCPVARKVVTLSTKDAESNSHVENLLERGVLRVLAHSTAERLHLQQDNTTIDRTLGVIAEQMRCYEIAYGTPQLAYEDAALWPHIVHKAVQ